ncbi:MAG: M28 family metallopeptidase [Bacteroidota bacterium]
MKKQSATVTLLIGTLLFLKSSSLLSAVPIDSSWIVSNYRALANRIIQFAQKDSSAYNRLAYLCDTFGPRLCGTQNLEQAIDWILSTMKLDGLDNVHSEMVMVPHWVRGKESIEMLEPRKRKLPMLGLGGSVGTPPEGITGEVLVVKSFDELTKRASVARGKIVLFNVPYTTYGATVQYRARGAIEAARAGAKASLIRSVTPFSLQTPHTGAMRYDQKVPKIPYAAVTIEDAEMMQRMQDRGQRIVVHLQMEAHTLPDVPSRNVVAELTGREKPDEIVVLGGHIDSWDVGEGAMDDAGGCIAAWEAARLLKQLGLKPRRTIRVVLWTNEENGISGAKGYAETHRNEIHNHILAIETDAGVFKPNGFGFTGSDSAFSIIRAIGKLLEPIGADTITKGGGGADISPLMKEGIPGMGLNVNGTRYFWYHHSDADTVEKLNPDEMNQCVAALAVMAYIVADLPEPFPAHFSPGLPSH